MQTLLRTTTLAAFALLAGMATAHDARLDADGCHHDGKDHHCHPGESSPARHVAPRHAGSSPDAVAGDSVKRHCTAASLGCDGIDKPVLETTLPRAADTPGRKERGTNAMSGMGGPGLALAVLMVLGMSAMRERYGSQRSSRHHN